MLLVAINNLAFGLYQLTNDLWAVPVFFTSPRGADITKTTTILEWTITFFLYSYLLPRKLTKGKGLLTVQSVNIPPAVIA